MSVPSIVAIATTVIVTTARIMEAMDTAPRPYYSGYSQPYGGYGYGGPGVTLALAVADTEVGETK